MNHWFTADFHLGHANIIKYCERPFRNVLEMNRTIIKKHNERVKKDDIVYFLGDFCFRNSRAFVIINPLHSASSLNLLL